MYTLTLIQQFLCVLCFDRYHLFSFIFHQLVAVLREVKYLKQLNGEEEGEEEVRQIPEKAVTLYAKDETYRKFLQNLDVTVTLYNKVSSHAQTY